MHDERSVLRLAEHVDDDDVLSPEGEKVLLKDVQAALEIDGGKDFRPVWDKLASARETFRERTFLGVTGKTRNVKMNDVPSVSSSTDGVRMAPVGSRSSKPSPAGCAAFVKFTTTSDSGSSTTAPSVGVDETKSV